MNIAICDHVEGLSRYCEEILRTWGLAMCELVASDHVATLDPRTTPVLILPAGSDAAEPAAAEFARRGGAVIAFNPGETLVRAAGLRRGAELDMPRSLTFAEWCPAWWGGEPLPVTGRGVSLEGATLPNTLACLGSSAGLVRAAIGRGKLLAFAFDLPLAVLLGRQGDPANHDRVGPQGGCCRPYWLAADLGAHQSGWIPFTDLLARSLVDLIRANCAAPIPLLWHLPGADSAALLLYSGDEDTAPVSANDDELDAVAAIGVRMDLYMIPIDTHSTRADAQRYARRHDLGPHPDLRPLDGRPIAERLASLEQQITGFEKQFGVTPTTARQHCTAWAGYLEPIEVYQRCGIRMESNYLNYTLFEARSAAPYHRFGSAMPMRFGVPSGTPGMETGDMLEVFQQPLHFTDDTWFGPPDYSLRMSPAAFERVIARVLDDMTGRFHTPLGTVIHPGNWVKFSREQGTELIRAAQRRGVLIRSFTRWCAWWDARDTWRVVAWEWDGSTLRCELRGEKAAEGLAVMLPGRWNVRGGEAREVERFGETWTAVEIPAGALSVRIATR